MKSVSSVNIETGLGESNDYVVTPNAQRVLGELIANVHSGVHSFSIIGTYGTGKSSFIMALEKGLKGLDKSLVNNNRMFFESGKYSIYNIVGEYDSFSSILQRKLKTGNEEVLKFVSSLCKKTSSKGQVLIVVVDEFGKILEHAAKVNPEEELYFIQQFCEIINHEQRKALFITTLHQNLGTYSKNLTISQRDEWKKVKGRFKEIVFSEPIEHLLFLASEQNTRVRSYQCDCQTITRLYHSARKCNLLSEGCSLGTALNLNPLDAFAASCLTRAIQKYGQNERSVASFLSARGKYSLHDTDKNRTLPFNLADVYDYLQYNMYSEIQEVNSDSTGWRALKIAIGRVESGIIPDEVILQALNTVKSIGLLNILAPPEASVDRSTFISYMKHGLGNGDAESILALLENRKIIKYASYKSQFVLFEGTDLDIEYELHKAASIVPVPSPNVDELREFISPKIVLASAYYYRTGTPRYFEFVISNTPEIRKPEGDIDGYCELVFPLNSDCKKQVLELSSQKNSTTVYAVFNDMNVIIRHLYEIKKLNYLLKTVATEDVVAIREVRNLIDREKEKLNIYLNDNLYTSDGSLNWYFNGCQVDIKSARDFNRLLSDVCAQVYPYTPVVKNELFNKQKLSSAISLAKSNLLDAVLTHSGEPDLGFPSESFPPEKSIFLSLLKNTGIYRQDSLGDYVYNEPTGYEFQEFWNSCQRFVSSTVDHPRKVSELIKLLSAPPFKVKQGFIDFWIPIYLYMRQQDYALYGASGNYVMNITKEVFDLLWKHPEDFTIKAFSVQGVKLEFFRKYRQFLKQDEGVQLGKDTFVETFKPFLVFYKRLNDYAKHTVKFNNPNVIRFRDALANAVDPEIVFFEKLPESLGYKGNVLAEDETFIEDYLLRIREAVQELNNCYPSLIGRIESVLLEELGLPSDFCLYKEKLSERYAGIKKFLLPQKSRTFLDRILAPADNSTEFIERISSVILDKQLSKILDVEEERLIDSLLMHFRELDRYSGLSSAIIDSSDDKTFSFDLVSTSGVNECNRIYRIPKAKMAFVEQRKKLMEQHLSGDNHIDICILLELLADKIKS